MKKFPKNKYKERVKKYTKSIKMLNKRPHF